MFQLISIVMGLIFLMTGGVFFYERFRSHKVLCFLAGLVSVTAFIYLAKDIYTDVKEDSSLTSDEKIETQTQEETFDPIKIDIKFVVDMNFNNFYLSKMPVIFGKMGRKISEYAISSNFKCGLIGYLNVERYKRLKFTVRNFTPNLLSFDRCSELLNVDSYPSSKLEKEAFAGVKEAILSHWSSNALRFIILIGSTSSSTIGSIDDTINEERLRSLADSQDIFIFSIHIREKFKEKSQYEIAATQYQILAMNPGTNEPSYVVVDHDDVESFEMIAFHIVSRLAVLLQ